MVSEINGFGGDADEELDESDFSSGSDFIDATPIACKIV